MTTDHSKQHYYRATGSDPNWRAIIFHYDETGNKIVTVWKSTTLYDTPEEAEDAATRYIEESELEAFVGEIKSGS